MADTISIDTVTRIRALLRKSTPAAGAWLHARGWVRLFGFSAMSAFLMCVSVLWFQSIGTTDLVALTLDQIGVGAIASYGVAAVVTILAVLASKSRL